jgi:hypothetical protein
MTRDVDTEEELGWHFDYDRPYNRIVTCMSGARHRYFDMSQLTYHIAPTCTSQRAIHTRPTDTWLRYLLADVIALLTLVLH